MSDIRSVFRLLSDVRALQFDTESQRQLLLSGLAEILNISSERVGHSEAGSDLAEAVSASFSPLLQSNEDATNSQHREAAIIELALSELRYLYSTGRLQSGTNGKEQLTPRQQQVLSLLLQGAAPKQIGSRLNLSVHTVRDYIKSIYRRFGVAGRDELVSRFVAPNNHH